MPDGDSAEIQFLYEGSYYTFSIWPRIVDASDAHITIRAARERDSQVLDEIDIRVGEPAVRTATSPSFGIAVLKIEQ